MNLMEKMRYKQEIALKIFNSEPTEKLNSVAFQFFDNNVREPNINIVTVMITV